MVRFKFTKGSGFRKYRVVISDKGKKIKTIQFGDRRYGQYKDKTPLKLYSKKDTLDPKRRKAYYSRHGKTATKWSPKWFAHKYLW